MTNKLIISRLKLQDKALDNADDLTLDDWIATTKIYILGLSYGKKDDYFKKEIIKILCDYINKMPFILKTDFEIIRYDKSKTILEMKKKLKNILESFIEILEIKEEALLDEERKELVRGFRNAIEKKELEKAIREEVMKEMKNGLEEKMKKEIEKKLRKEIRKEVRIEIENEMIEKEMEKHPLWELVQGLTGIEDEETEDETKKSKKK